MFNMPWQGERGKEAKSEGLNREQELACQLETADQVKEKRKGGRND